MSVKRWGDTTRPASFGALLVLGFAVVVGACGDRVEEADPGDGGEDMALALEAEAEPELADVGDAEAAPGDAARQEDAEPVSTPSAARPESEASPPPPPTQDAPSQASPVRGVPPVAEAPMVPADEAPVEVPMMTITASVGSEFEAELVEELSTKTNKPGDQFKLRVTSPLIDGRRVIVQQNAYVTGEVTAVQKSGSSGESAVIKVTFHDVSFLGKTWPISATVVEAEPTTEGRYSTGDKAARVGAGAVAGAILGRVIGGNTTGTVIGAAVGAAAGTAITLVTEDVDAVLPEGSILRLRLDKPFTITAPSNTG